MIKRLVLGAKEGPCLRSHRFTRPTYVNQNCLDRLTCLSNIIEMPFFLSVGHDDHRLLIRGLATLCSKIVLPSPQGVGQ